MLSIEGSVAVITGGTSGAILVHFHPVLHLILESIQIQAVTQSLLGDRLPLVLLLQQMLPE